MAYRSRMTSSMPPRHVASTVTGTVTSPCDLALSVAVSRGVPLSAERLVVTVNDVEQQVDELDAPLGTRVHLLRDAPVGTLRVEYEATVSGPGDIPVGGDFDRIVMQRPSRYCPSEMFQSLGRAEFGDLQGRELLDAVATRVNEALVYDGAETRVTDTSLDTWLRRTGVCRDFTHVVISFLRARNVPARLTAVYAPGLVPMDFHAIVEAWIDDAWWIVDATRLAPRPAMVRISTGRDAADTAFLTVLRGTFAMGSVNVSAAVDGEQPSDVHGELHELR